MVVRLKAMTLSPTIRMEMESSMISISAQIRRERSDRLLTLRAVFCQVEIVKVKIEISGPLGPFSFHS